MVAEVMLEELKEKASRLKVEEVVEIMWHVAVRRDTEYLDKLRTQPDGPLSDFTMQLMMGMMFSMMDKKKKE